MDWTPASKVMLTQLAPNVDAIIIFYSTTSFASYRAAKALWEDVLELVYTPFKLGLVATKNDLVLEREVAFKKGANLGKRWECQFIECSAKDGVVIEEPMEEFIREIGKLREQERKKAEKKLRRDSEPKASFWKRLLFK
jgi:GTPase KRas protein